MQSIINIFLRVLFLLNIFFFVENFVFLLYYITLFFWFLFCFELKFGKTMRIIFFRLGICFFFRGGYNLYVIYFFKTRRRRKKFHCKRSKEREDFKEITFIFYYFQYIYIYIFKQKLILFENKNLFTKKKVLF